eukprot:TRINITY_DN14672_c0_g1_i4.p1 TRINITY_DN14672_c0_g1~~TRINITY_DN14672_c0_g1_i4.p1  ORF type:complete len:543 (-),score=89.01 TRINITY_DN14672_c0_g1_i4:171-1763(-)
MSDRELMNKEAGQYASAQLLATEASSDQDKAPRPAAEPLESRPANVDFSCGIYTAVLVSAFGGVKVVIEGEGHGKDIKLHPFFVLLMAIPIFMVQLSALMALRLSCDLNAHIYSEGEEHNVLLILKLLMVFVLQLMNFEYLLTTMKLMVFVLNPLTWVDIEYPKFDDWVVAPDGGWERRQDDKCVTWLQKHIYHSRVGHFLVRCQAPWAILALLMRFGIGYLVCVDSVSIILLADDCKEAIFNCLAITFIVDLTTHWWTMVEAIFHFDKLSNFEFKLAKGVWIPIENKADSSGGEAPTTSCCKWWAPHTKTVSDEVAAEFLFPGLIKGLVESPLGLILRREGSARSLESVTTFLMMFLVYFQQLCVIVFAIHTNVLPIARDVCTMWRWQRGNAAFLKKTAKIVVAFMQYGIFFDVDKELEKVLDNTTLCEAEPKGDHYRMVISDRKKMAREYPMAMFGGTFCIVALLILPQVFRGMHSYLIKSLGGAASGPASASKESDTGYGQVPADDWQSRLEKLEAELEKLKASRPA